MDVGAAVNGRADDLADRDRKRGRICAVTRSSISRNNRPAISRRTLTLFAAIVCVVVVVVVAGAQPTSDKDTLAAIQREGLQHSQVPAVFEMLTVNIGPRLTASPAHKRAAEWARDRLPPHGLTKAQPRTGEVGPRGA